ncbi:MAG: AI-2E family transporter [Chloroflexi bacterium]|nr:AI-2E family transporter [Chloroflexota bacterium]
MDPAKPSDPSSVAVESPPWSPTTKLVVGLTMVAIFAGLLIRFRDYIAPLILAGVLAYLLYPLCAWVARHTPLSWRASVTLVYLVIVGLLLAGLILSGLALIQQFQSLYQLVSDFFTADLPALAERLSNQVIRVGPFTYDLGQYDLPALSQQFISLVQPVLGQLGVLVSFVATRTLAIIGWLGFILLISFFLLAESDPVQLSLIPLDLPRYGQDLRRLAHELGRIWNTFLRGQFTAFVAMSLLAALVLTVLGVRYSLGLAFLVGIARFIPYIGPMVVYIILAFVITLQPENFWGITPWKHAVLVIAVIMFLDQIFDNIVMPRFFGRALGVHPAAVLITALLAADLIGFLGFMLAAPLVASGKLLLRYIIRKMFDLNPWPEDETPVHERQSKPPSRRARLWQTLRTNFRRWRAGTSGV